MSRTGSIYHLLLTAHRMNAVELYTLCVILYTAHRMDAVYFILYSLLYTALLTLYITLHTAHRMNAVKRVVADLLTRYSMR